MAPRVPPLLPPPILLPPNASDLERALVRVDAERLGDIEVAIAALWSPWTCPEAFLPWLAWAFSVDVWDPRWSVPRKRAVIAASFGVHTRKGTRRAVREALAALGFTVDITEWWEEHPAARRGTFAIEVATEEALTPERQAEALSVVMATKNVRSHLSSLKVVLQQKSETPRTAAASLVGETIAVYPWMSDDITTRSSVPCMAAALYGAEVGIVYPKEAA